MGNEKAWADVYSIPKNQYYLHTNPDNFLHRYQKQLTTIDSAYDNLLGVVRKVLKDHMKKWKVLQAGLIAQANKELVYKGTSAKGFLKEYQKQYDKIVAEGALSGKLYEFKKIANSFVHQQTEMRKAKTKDEKKRRMALYMKMMQNNLKNMFEAIIYIYNSENRIENKWAQFMGIDVSQDIEDTMPNLALAKKAIWDTLKLLGLVTGDPTVTIEQDVMKRILGILNEFSTKIKPLTEDGKIDDSDMVGKFYTLVTRQDMERFIKGEGWGDGLLKVFGRLLEDAHSEETVSRLYDSGFSSDVVDIDDINKGSKLQNFVTMDTVDFTWTIDEETISGGTSRKLTKAPGVLNKTYGVVDLVNTQVLSSKFMGQTAIPKNKTFLSTIRWLRANMEALKNASVQEMTSDFKGVTEADMATFYKQEKNLAALATLPRLLDGVYDYSTDQVKLRKVDNVIYWTAMINVRGTYIWIYDILKLIYDSLGTSANVDNAYNYFEVKNITYDVSTPADYWRLWTEKRGVLDDFKLLGEEIKYHKIYSQMESSFKAMNQKAKLYSSPYKSIKMDLKLGNMKAKFGIK